MDEGLSTDADSDGHYTPGSCATPADGMLVSVNAIVSVSVCGIACIQSSSEDELQCIGASVTSDCMPFGC